MKNKQSLKSFVGFIVEFVLGLLFVLFPTQFQNFIIYVFGAVLILLGLVQILVYLFGKIRSSDLLVFGILFILIGIPVVILNDFLGKMIPVVVGILLIVQGTSRILLSVSLRPFKNLYLVNLITGLVNLVFGILLFVFNGQKMIGYLIGGFLLADAIFDLIELLFSRKSEKKAGDRQLNDSSFSNGEVIDTDFEEHQD